MSEDSGLDWFICLCPELSLQLLFLIYWRLPLSGSYLSGYDSKGICEKLQLRHIDSFPAKALSRISR